MTQPTKVLLSQDLSCVGQISLGVALPLFAALGFEACPLPTALLSTHTGGFGANTFHDLTPEMPKILTHWQQLDLSFQGLCLGYLGANALAVWQQWLPKFAATPLRLIDPVMADNGQFYTGFDQQYAQALGALLPQATVITPNITEAQLLLGQTPVLTDWTAAQAEQLAEKLSQQFQVATVVLTGIPLGNQVGVSTYQAGHTATVQQPRQPGHYFGTGDLFASVLGAALLRQQNLTTSVQLGMDFVAQAIAQTRADQGDPRFGLHYQGALRKLMQTLK